MAMRFLHIEAHPCLFDILEINYILITYWSPKYFFGLFLLPSSYTCIRIFIFHLKAPRVDSFRLGSD